jgi:hypothetical protein
VVAVRLVAHWAGVDRPAGEDVRIIGQHVGEGRADRWRQARLTAERGRYEMAGVSIIARCAPAPASS